MTIEELSNIYTQRIKKSTNKYNETLVVINKINSLTYSNGDNISREDKLKIFENVYSNLTDDNVIFYKYEYKLLEKSNNENYLTMLSAMIQTLKDNSSKKS